MNTEPNPLLLHGADIVKYWQPQNEREAHLLSEIEALLKIMEASEVTWEDEVFDLKQVIDNMETEYKELEEEFRQYKFSTA